MSTSIDAAIKAAEREAQQSTYRAARYPPRAPSADVPAESPPEASSAELLPRDKFTDSATPVFPTEQDSTRQSNSGLSSPRDDIKTRRRTLTVVDVVERVSPPSFLEGSRRMICSSYLNLLLLFLPLGVVAEMKDWSDGLVFGLNCIAILPLAKLLGDATEQVAAHTNDTIGGLLNATFGNATELIVSLFALSKGLLGVVKVSLLGSIISNILLVLGCSCIAGGVVKPVQKFNCTAASANTTLLLMSILGMSIPAALFSLGEGSFDQTADLMFSRLTAVILLFLYFLYIYFQLFTHRTFFEAAGSETGDSGGKPPGASRAPSQASDMPALYSGFGSSTFRSRSMSRAPSNGSLAIVPMEDDFEEVLFGLPGSLFWLGFITVAISFLSEFITGAIEGAWRPSPPEASAVPRTLPGR